MANKQGVDESGESSRHTNKRRMRNAQKQGRKLMEAHTLG